MPTDSHQAMDREIPPRRESDAELRLAPDFWLDLSVLLGGLGLIVASVAMFMRAA